MDSGDQRPAGVADLPSGPREAVQHVTDWARTAFADRLVSVVIHGSLAFGCWGPDSDIDVLLVVEEQADMSRFHALLVAGDPQAPGNGFELSVVSRTAALTSRHPITFQYHFSRGRVARQNPVEWDLFTVNPDPDLAGHFLVAWTVGITAYGLPARQVLRRVDDEEFLASISADVLDSCAELLRLTPNEVPVPVYAVLNAARTLIWLDTRTVLSKREGGRLLRHRHPAWTDLLDAALDEHAASSGRLVRTHDLQELARHLSNRLTIIRRVDGVAR